MVYRATDTRLNREVALKIIFSVDQISASMLKRFQQEAQALAKLDHAHIIRVLDYGEHTPEGGAAHNLPFLVMDYLAAGTLAEIEKPLPYDEDYYASAPSSNPDWAVL